MFEIRVDQNPVSASVPLEVRVRDNSGCHVEVTLAVADLPPIRHAFAFTTGEVVLNVPDVPAGKKVKATFIVQAFHRKEALNRRYDVQLELGGVITARAKGNIPKSRSNDFGLCDFVIATTP